MSDANRIRVSLVEESTFGTTPASPTMLILPTTGQSLRDRLGYQQSQTIRSDRNVQDLIRLSKMSGGGLPCELQFPVANEALWAAVRATLCATESAAVTVNTSGGGNGIVIGDDPPTITHASGWTGFVVGDVIKVTGASASADNRYAVVTDISGNVMTVTLGDGETWAASDTAVTVTRGARMTNGTTDRSFSIEVARLDVAKYQVFTGQVFDTMDIQVADEAITTASFGLMGKSSTRGGAAISGATYSEPTAGSVLDSQGVPFLLVGGYTVAAKSISVSFANNVGARTQVGALGPQSMRRGTFSVTGRISVYFDDWVQAELFNNNTATDVVLVLQDSSSQGFSISLPQVKFADVSTDTRGLNQDDFLDLSFQAYLDPVELITARVQRFA